MCSICFNTEHLTSENAAGVDASLGNAGFWSNDYINGLIWGGGWTGPADVYYTIDEGTYGGEGWELHEVTAIQNAVAAYNNVCNIDLSYVLPGDPNVNIIFGTLSNVDFYNAFGVSALGIHEVPDGTDMFDLGPEVCIGVYNYDFFSQDFDSFDIGGFDYITLIHELGHGLGLAHPHDNGGYSSVFPGVTSSFGDYGDDFQNQGIFTTMSYNDGWQSVYPSHSDVGYGYQGTPMAFDIAALQILYGANNSYNTGNNTYYLPTVNGQNQNTYWSCIWDAGGTDTISNVGSSISCNINLNEAPLVGEYAGGYVSWNNNIVGGFTIANGVIIENANGGDGDDDITVNSASNVIDGNGGTDYVFFSDTKESVISSLPGSIGFHDNDTSAIVIEGAYGTDTIVDCEYIFFSDQFFSVADLKAEYASNYNPLFANSTSGEAPFVMSEIYNGPVDWLQFEYLAQEGNIGNIVAGSNGNDFINLLGGDDAANGGAGDDVIDGGLGSNFLTGGDGTDTFFIDGRSGLVTWSTITDWDNSEQLSVWGWNSNSTIAWYENLGADGYKGATFEIDLDGDGDIELKCTFTDFEIAEIKAPTEFEDSSLLWFV